MAAVPLACVALLPSCSFDDDYDGGAQGGKGPVAVKLSVTAGEPGDLNGTRAAGDLVEGGDGEFMHTLRVYIVKLDAEPVTTVLDLSDEIAADFAQNPLAESGNVKRWNFDDLSLAPGRYAVYAFANIEDYSGVFDSPTSNGTQTATGEEMLENTFTENYELRDDNLNSYRLTNPAGVIKPANGKFIPMSARYEFTVSGDLNESGETVFSIGLDRLVSKVQLQLGEEGQAQLPGTCSLIFSGCSQNVPLMARAANTSTDEEFAQYYGTRMATTTKNNVKGGQLVEFYVNETPDGDPFTVNLNTAGTTGLTTYTSTTVTTTELPRNSIFPLKLTFSDFGISVDPTAWLKVTGVPYDVYYEPVEEGVYRVEIATGSYFNLAPNSVTADGTEAISNVTWTWTVPNQLPTGYVVTAEGSNVKGHVPAGGSAYYDEFTLLLNGKWTYNGADYDRTYKFIVDVCHDESWAMGRRTATNANSRAAEMPSPAYRLAPEYLNMFKVK